MKPFLKWAGNKYQIIKQILAVLPPGKRLLEPFAGSAAVFLNTRYPRYLLTDVNADLINLYLYLQRDGGRFIDYCRDFFQPENNTAEKFYELRALFNTTGDVKLKSALFLYLNKHCFNGLCRYNARNQFNTPFGQHKKPYFPERELNFFHQQAQKAELAVLDFQQVMQNAKKGDVIYCDPPYVPLSESANFTSYQAYQFTVAQQAQLAELARITAKRGITVIISNHATPFTEALYQDAQQIIFPVRRSINCNPAKRKPVLEMLAVFT